MRTYDIVLKLLREHEELRSSDRKLLWAIWEWQGIADTHISKEKFLSASVVAEGITRARRKAQELHPELQATQEVKKARKIKQEQKSELIFDEVRQVYKYC